MQTHFHSIQQPCSALETEWFMKPELRIHLLFFHCNTRHKLPTITSVSPHRKRIISEGTQQNIKLNMQSLSQLSLSVSVSAVQHIKKQLDLSDLSVYSLPSFSSNPLSPAASLRPLGKKEWEDPLNMVKIKDKDWDWDESRSSSNKWWMISLGKTS